MMTLLQINLHRFGLPVLVLALLIGLGFSASGAGRSFFGTACPVATALIDTTTVEASICTGIAYEFGDQMLTESGTYTETFMASDGTDSTVVLILTVLPAPVTDLFAGICEGDTYEFFGETLTETGTYSHTLTTPEGCDSIINLILRVVPFFDIMESARICEGDTIDFGGVALTESGIYVDSLTAVGGCDSIRTLVLTVLKHSETNWNVGICEGSTFIFNGDTLDQSGMYVHVLPAANGCDSIITLNLTVAAFFETEFSVTICEGESYSFAGEDLTSSGIYMDSLLAAGGCDSTLILNLTVLPPTPTTFAVATICDNQTYTFGDLDLVDPGTYTATLEGPNGCDSTVVLTLTVLPTSSTDISATICSNETYEIAGLSLNETGEYSFVFPAENGCDSTVLLQLTVLPTSETTFNETICNGSTFEFEGEILDASGTYSATYTAENGCDSTVVLNLVVLPELITDLEATICTGESYEFDGIVLTDPGFYTALLSSELGCDSTVNLTLTVAPLEETELVEAICPGTSYNFNGEELSEAGVYVANLTTVFGCDSTVTLTLSIFDPIPVTELSVTICEGESYFFFGLFLTAAGQYDSTLLAANGCDSVIVLNLEVLPVSTTELTEEICAGESVEFNGMTQTESGIYTEIGTGANGCDSLTTLNLTVLPVLETTLDISICANETYEFQGDPLNTAGTYTAVLVAPNGCDSTITLNLEVLPLSETALNVSICSNESYPFNGQNLNTSGTYTALLAAENGCDSTVTLILDVLEAPVTTIQATICSNQTYDFNGEPLDMSGVYVQGFVAENGCDSSVVLTLTVLPIADITVSAQICDGSTYFFDGEPLNSSGTYFGMFVTTGGCDSLVTLELSVLDTLVTNISATICGNESYLFNNEALTESGTYEAFFTASGDCDSLVVLALTVLPTSSTDLEASICAGESYEFQGIALTESGIYAVLLTNADGCDSTITLTLTVLETSSTDLEASICAGESYEFQGDMLTEAGVYTAMLTNAAGCDSTVTLTLAVSLATSSELEASICEGESYDFNGDDLTESGVYTALLTNAAGCDSTVTLTLTVLETSSTDLVESICTGESYLFNGDELTETGIYTVILTNAAGCDSTVTLRLRVLPASQTNLSERICVGETYEFQGALLSASGTYTALLPAANGCDSLVVLELFVLPTVQTDLQAQICDGDSYDFNGEALTEAGVYTALLTGSNGCDSIVVLTLGVTTINTAVSLSGNTLTAAATNVAYQWIDCTTNTPIAGATESSFTPSVTGNYAVVLTTPDGCSATSVCIDVIIVSTGEALKGLAWQIQPNPARTSTTIRLENPLSTELYLELFDQTGRILNRQRIAEGAQQVEIDLKNLPQGLFLVRLTNGQNSSETKRLVKLTD